MEGIDSGAVKKGLDRYTEMVWRPIVEGELRGIKGKIVVDMGCGFARYTSHLVEANEYHGVDLIDTPFVDIRSSVETIPLPNSYADIVVAIGILDYADPVSTLSEAFRILKPSGGLYLMVPNYLSPYHMISSLFGSRKDKRRYIEHEIVEYVDNAGFVIDHIKVKGFCFYVPTLFLQEVMIPVFGFFDGMLGEIMGNNIFMRAHKPKR